MWHFRKFMKNWRSTKMSVVLALTFFGIAGLLTLWDGKSPPEWPYSAAETAEKVSLSEFKEILNSDGDGRRIAILEDRIYIERTGTPAAKIVTEGDAEPPGSSNATYIESPHMNSPFVGTLMSERILDSGFEVEVFPHAGARMTYGEMLSAGLQIVFIVVVIAVLLKMTGKGAGGNFGTESGHSFIDHDDLTVGLHDVAGLATAKEAASEIISLVRNEGSATMAGGRPPRGLLLDGPAGTGKTLLAKAIAKEAGVSFISVDASSLSQMFAGLGAMKVRRIFRKARKQAPCIVFIDEIDAAGGARGRDGTGSSSEKDNTLNALLTELDGLGKKDGLFVIGATNRPGSLDSALVRSGRIDRKITLGLPDIQARYEILKVHCRGKLLSDDIEMRQIASTSYQMSGADLENLVNTAALMAGTDGRTIISMDDFRRARDRMLLPQSGGSVSLMEDERRLTAIHEAGHAVAALLQPHADRVEKVTITPQGQAMGFVLQSPERDRVFETKARLKARLVVAVAGREAERIVLGDDMITTGAASDIRQATQLARAMVMTYGMSGLGFIEIDPHDASSMDVRNPPSRMVLEIIDAAISTCSSLLERNRDAVDALSSRLLEKETLSGSEVQAIVLACTTSDRDAKIVPVAQERISS